MTVVLHPLEIVSVANAQLGECIGSLAPEGSAIADALDTHSSAPSKALDLCHPNNALLYVKYILPRKGECTMQTICATDLARRTRQILDAVAGRGESIAIERNRVCIATIVPAQTTMSAQQQLAGFRPLLNPADGEAWLKESRDGFGNELDDPWA